MAIRYFAGGSPIDIALVHGVNHLEVFKSCWAGVDAVHMCKDLDILFTSDHNAQQQIAADFAEHSVAGFRTYCSTIDGILIWMNRPAEADCEFMEVGPRKFESLVLICRLHAMRGVGFLMPRLHILVRLLIISHSLRLN